MTLIQGQDEAVDTDKPGLEIIYFTDPYCSWCWASEPLWLRLREAYGGHVGLKIVMGGLVENAHHMLADDGERLQWLRAHLHDVSARSGQPIDPSFLDGLDPDFSSWPACIHVKAAQAQAEDLGERLLRRLRIGVMMEAKHASDPRVAESMLGAVEGLEPTAWKGALSDGTALKEFMADRRRCQESGVSGFPTFIIRNNQGDAPRVLPGYRPYPDIERAVQDLAPWLEPNPTRPVIDQLFDIGPMTTKEIQEVQGTTPRETLDVLDGLAAEGSIEAHRLAGGTLWSLPGDWSA